MNTLSMIKNQINRAQKLHEARLSVVTYRGVNYKCESSSNETHGTFCYRGRTYQK